MPPSAVPIITALGSVPWETELISALDASSGVDVVRRCVDVVDLLAVAATGQARAALVSGALRNVDVDAVDRLTAAGVVTIGVVPRDDAAAQRSLVVLGVRHFVPPDAEAEVISAVVATAVEEGDAGAGVSFANPVAATATVVPPSGGAEPVRPTARRGVVVAVWGPTGAPGRTTLAVNLADELARRGHSTLLIDADCYGGVIAPVLGLLDESPGLAAACRSAAATRLDSSTLAGLCWQLGEQLRVLTGIPRADRWTELRPASVPGVLTAARALVEYTVIDCGFSLEADEELSYDTVAPRRNGITLALLGDADMIFAVGAGDPIGLQRLVRGLADLQDVEFDTPIWVVLNRVRASVVPGRPEEQLRAALQRFAGREPAAYLPNDTEALDAALTVGKTLAEARPSSRLRRAIADLAATVTGADATGSSGGRRRHAASRR